MNRLVIELLSIEKGKAYGYQEYVFNLLNYFYTHRDNIKYKEIIILCKRDSTILFDGYSDKFTIKSYSYSSYLKLFWLLTFTPFMLGLGKNDLLFSPGNYSGWIKRCPELLVIHDLLYKRKQWIPSKLMRFQREIFVPHSIKKADGIIAISNFTKDDVEYYYPQSKGKIEVIYNSFNFQKYEESDLSEKPNFPYFLTIANSANYKNLKTILEAFSQYCKKGGDKNFVFVGTIKEGTDAYAAYENLSKDVQHRVFTRCKISNAELGCLYRNASCYISASKFEGLGMPVVEAMSFGLPVLLSNIPPHKEVSLNKGEYFEPEDIDGLSNKMLCCEFGDTDYAHDIHKLFSEENTSAKYVDLFNTMVVK